MGKNAKLEITLWLSALGLLTACLGGAIFYRLNGKDESPGAQMRDVQHHHAQHEGGKNPNDSPPATVVTVSADSTAPDFVAQAPGSSNWNNKPGRKPRGDGLNNPQDSAIMPVSAQQANDPLSTDPLNSQPTNSQPRASIATLPAEADQGNPNEAPLPDGPQSSNMRPGSRVMLKTIQDERDPLEPAQIHVVDAKPLRQDTDVVPVADNGGLEPQPAAVPWQQREVDGRPPLVSAPAALPSAPIQRNDGSLPPPGAAYSQQQSNDPPPRAFRPQANVNNDQPYAPPPSIDRSRMQSSAAMQGATQNNVPNTLPGAPSASAVSSATSGTSAQARKEDKYAVQPNDNWWTISQRVYGNGAFYKALHEYNRREFPRADALAVGDKIRTPDLAVLQKNYPDLTPKARKPAAVAGTHMANVSAHLRPGTRSYTVQQGDTMFDIARYQLGKASRWTEIYELNRDTLSEDFDFLRPGTQLLLPADEATDHADPTARAPGGTQQR